MKEKIIKNKKGITLTMLILTIIILLILLGVSISNIDIGTDIRDYNYMCADIELLESKIMTYYNKNSSLPIIGDSITEAITVLGDETSSRDNSNYYQIDLSLLNNISLNYGGGTTEDNDIYIINEQSHEVYYLKGTTYEGIIYHTEM